MSQFAPRWDAALTFDQFVKECGTYCELWTGVYRTARIPEWAKTEATRLGRKFRLVVLAEDWCGDASSTVPVIARWVEEAANIELRILRRDENPQVMDRYLTDGSRSIPLVIVLTDEMEEIGRWGPRPAVLQAYVLEQRKTRTSRAYYPEVRRWYARDKGESTLRELLQVMARAPTAGRGG